MLSDQKIVGVSNSEHLQAHQIGRNYNCMNAIHSDAINRLQPMQWTSLCINKAAINTEVRDCAA
jgi:hypothetical protein